MSQAKIFVVGSYLAGLTMRMDEFPVVGQTLMGYDYQALHGGKGSNQAVAAARLGAKVAFAGSVGNDANGQLALDLYRDEGIDSSCTLVSDDMPTGVAFILVNKAGENLISLDTGACHRMNAAFVEGLKDAVAGYDIIMTQQEIPMEAVLAAAKLAKACGKRFILNPAPYCELPEEIYPLVDVITPNEGEARQILGLKPDDNSVSEKEIADTLRARGVKNVVITLGDKGVYYQTDEGEGLVPARKVDAVDTTGAGDSFAGAFATALGEGMPIKDAIDFAQHAASISVCSYGVIESLPTRAQLEA